MTEFYTITVGDEFKVATFARDSSGRTHFIPVDDERATRLVPTSWVEVPADFGVDFAPVALRMSAPLV